MGQHVHASNTKTCQLELSIHNYHYSPCQNLPLLDVANDSRVNVALLLEDWGLAKINNLPNTQSLWLAKYNQAPFLAEDLLNQTQQARFIPQVKFNQNHLFETHCASLRSGTARFNNQVNTLLDVPRRDKRTLVNTRQQLDLCEKSLKPLVVLSHWSNATQQYATYLNASIAFSQGDFAKAIETFATLLSSTDIWLKEASQYMIIRAHLAAAVDHSKDEKGQINFKAIDYKSLTHFFKETTQYFKLYPEGEYAVHTRGLLRHGYWLISRQDLLINEIAWQIQHPYSKFYNLDITDIGAEIEQRILQHPSFDPNLLKDPFLLTISNLVRMRQDNKSKIKTLRWSELNDQKNYYLEHPELFRYLRALHLFVVQKNPDEALQHLPLHESISASDHLQFSQIVLRGRIFEGRQQAYVNEYWLNLLDHAKNTQQRAVYELALFKYFSHPLHYENFVGTQALFQQSYLQRHFIQNIANETALKAMIQAPNSTVEQKYASTFTLMEKSLMHQNFALFNQAYRQWMPSNPQLFEGIKQSTQPNFYESQPPFAKFIWHGPSLGSRLKCASLADISRRLAQSPQDQLNRVCFGEYLRSAKGASILKTIRNKQQSRTFAGPVFARGEAYRDIIDQAKPSELHAYALFRAVQCYAPSGINECGDKNVPLETRKEWYVKLKQDYPNSIWAKNLIYYW